MEKLQGSSDTHFHVLAVDDSLIDRKILERLLTVSSYQVTSVESGSKALEFLGLMDGMDSSSGRRQEEERRQLEFQKSNDFFQMQDVKVNLIITDYCMPGMSGYELLKRIKESSRKDIPVVVMSSENVPSRISRCLEGGAEEFLLKPVRLSDMEKIHPHLLKSQQFMDNNKSNNSRKRKAISPQPVERSSKSRGLRVA